MKRILFVDDQTNVLQGLKRMLRPMRDDWEMAFVESGEAALESLAKDSFDVVITDMRMPGMDGAQLLAEIAEHYPEIVRIVLSGQADKESVMRSTQNVHQYLSKPCDPDVLITTVSRACAMREVLDEPSLREIVGKLATIPSLPSLYVKLVEELQQPEVSLQKVGAIVSLDLGMSTKILQLVNSVFFGFSRHVSNPVEAVMLLGVDTVKALVLSVKVFSQFDQKTLKCFSIETLLNHSLAVAGLAKDIAQLEEADSVFVDHSFMAGMLHDVGKLVLAANDPERFEESLTLAKEQQIPSWQAENEIFGATHAQVGAYLVGLWGLPDPIVEAILYHASPGNCAAEEFAPLSAVHAADSLLSELERDESKPIDVDYIEGIGLTNRVAAWRTQLN